MPVQTDSLTSYEKSMRDALEQDLFPGQARDMDRQNKAEEEDEEEAE